MRRALLAALVVLAGCSSSKDANNDGVADGTYKPNDVVLVAPSTPKGNVAGLVLDADGAPLSGATVKVALAGNVAPQTTDPSGHFVFTGLPAGSSVGVTISHDGYTTAYGQATIPGAVGNSPINDGTAYIGPISLFPTTGKLDVQVVGYDGQTVAATGVLQVTPAYVDATSGSRTLAGWTVSKATASNGVLSFGGIPELIELARLSEGGPQGSGFLSLAVDPVDSNGDGRFDYGGATLQISVADAIASPGALALVLPPPAQSQGALEIVGSSCGTLVGNGAGGVASSLISPTDKVYVAFNQRVLQGSLSIQVLDDDGTPITVTPDYGSTGTVVDFGGDFPAGHALQVTIAATAADSRPSSQLTFSGTCFIAPARSSPQVAKAVYLGPAGSPLVPGSEVKVTFDSALGNESQVPAFAAYFDADLDGDGKRQSVGEYDPQGRNTAGGFLVTIDPAQGTALGGRFSRFFHFTYAVGTLNVAANKGVYFDFNDTRTPGTTSVEWVTGAVLGKPAIQGFITPVSSF